MLKKVSIFLSYNKLLHLVITHNFFFKEDAVLSDELNHASIIDGIRLCKANRYRYKHLDLNDLEEKLQDAQVCVLKPVNLSLSLLKIKNFGN